MQPKSKPTDASAGMKHYVDYARDKGLHVINTLKRIAPVIELYLPIF